MATIGSANIVLSADAAGFGQDLQAAQGSLNKFQLESNRTLGKLGEIGERLGSAIGRADALGAAFNRLSGDGNKFAAAMDVAQASIGSLISAMMIARSTGASMLSGLMTGLSGLAISSLLSSLSSSTPTEGGRFAGRAGATASSTAGLGDAVGLIGSVWRGGTATRDTLAGLSSAEGLGGIGADADRTAERFRLLTDAVGRSAEELEMLALMRRRDELISTHGREITGSPVYAALSTSISDARVALRGLTEARERDRVAALAAADAERLRAEHAAAWTSDMARGRSVMDSLRTPRESAIAELRELVSLSMRTPGAISEDAIRRRAGVLAGGLSEGGPIGPAAMGIGESATLSTIAAAGRRSGPTAEDLLAEVRDELGRIRDAVAAIGSSAGSALGGILGVMGRP